MSRIGLASALVATVAVTSISPLRVLRVAPEGTSDPTPEITVTFDRPVAGGLDATVRAGSIFRIEPDVPGSVEWRDPFTIRFLPDSALTPGATYTVRVSDDFVAVDGNSLSGPFEHTFSVRPGTILNGFPIRKEDRQAPRHIGPRPTLRLLARPWLARPQRFAERAYIRMSRPCATGRIGLEFVAQRPMDDSDPGYFSWEDWHPRMDRGDDGRRIVELRPTQDLPRGCTGTLTIPLGDEPLETELHWAFQTYGSLGLAEASCARLDQCPTGPLYLRFNNPVVGADLLRHLSIEPAVDLSVRDTSQALEGWRIQATLNPRTEYRITVGEGLPDLFEQTLNEPVERVVRTTGYGTSASYSQGRLLIERERGSALPVLHINADTLVAVSAPVPRRFEGAFLASNWGWQGPWDSLASSADTMRLAVPSPQDQGWVTAVPLAQSSADRSTLTAIRVAARANADTAQHGGYEIALTQVTDLGVHARLGAEQGMVWVTDVSDGEAVDGARVTVFDPTGAERATGVTDPEGLVVFPALRTPTSEEDCDSYGCAYGFEGYVAAELGADRALVGLSRYDPDLAPWRFDLLSAWGADEHPLAATVFTERGIYRPGETVHAKTIVRRGPLGILQVAPGDSLRWTWLDRERELLHDTVVSASDYGTSTSSFDLGVNQAIGNYTASVQAIVQGQWTEVGAAYYRIAEYRPPEFLIDAASDREFLLAGDTARVTVSGRYLFGAPMAGAPVQWSLRAEPQVWGLSIPGAEDFSFGARYGWWDGERNLDQGMTETGVDTLSAQGTAELIVAPALREPGVAVRGTLQATVTDANRQTSTAAASVIVHPAAFYIGANTPSDAWFWTAGEPAHVNVITVQPGGQRVAGISVSGQVVRREWHRVRRLRGGEMEEIGQWVTDTVATCAVSTADDPVPCTFTPPGGGSYRVELEAQDAQGRLVRTQLYRWASGTDWVPWNDDARLNMDVIVDRDSYEVGDTATVLFASPFTDAEAWVTVEREQVIESRRLRITSGATSMKLPITEALAPNAFISIVVVKGRTAEPSGTDDPGRPTLRVGYAEIRVLPESKRLQVAIEPQSTPSGQILSASAAGLPNGTNSPVTYQPGDTAAFEIAVQNASGEGAQSEVTLWAVDEGVLALTGYRTPDPIDLLYRERGLGVRLGSNLTSVAAQIPEGEKGQREPGGGGGDDAASVLRSRFQTTAFFLGSIETDALGRAQVDAPLPDNLTTFRVMAVAVTKGDRYGSGDASILVTRPLLVRPALPRFVRADDQFLAGVVVNQRLGRPLNVEVTADATGIALSQETSVRTTLDALRGREVRFDFTAQDTDSASFEFAVSGTPANGSPLAAGIDLRDAQRVRLPVRPAFHPLVSSSAGALASTPQSVSIALRDDIDASRSRLEISFGTSPLSVMHAIERRLRAYPYQCTEQVTSAALAMLARHRVEGLQSDTANAGPPAAAGRARIQSALRILQGRQRSDGALGYWGGSDWSTPWLSAYAGRVLLEAHEGGFDVDSTVVARLSDYVTRTLEDPDMWALPAMGHTVTPAQLLGERLMAADFLSRAGVPNAAVENDLLQSVSLMRFEDRALLAEVLARSGRAADGGRILDALWGEVRVEGRKATLPPSEPEHWHYFESPVRGVARLLSATLAVEPDHPNLGALMESLLDRARSDRASWWNTQDYAFAVLAAADLAERQQAAPPRPIRIRGRAGVVADLEAVAGTDTVFTLDGLVAEDAEGGPRLQLAFGPQGGAGDAGAAPVYYFVTVHEVPTGRAIEPIDRGMVVERWYEDLETGQPIVAVDEGQLVRVGVRVTLPADRQFVVVDDPLPAGLEAVDLSLRTVQPPGARFDAFDPPQDGPQWFGSWNSGLWSPFEHQEIRDDRVVYSSAFMPAGSYSTSYVARATTAGTFVVPPAHAEEMYNPGVNGRTGGSTFTVREVSER